MFVEQPLAFPGSAIKKENNVAKQSEFTMIKQMFRAKIYLKKLNLYTKIVRASVKNSMNGW